MKIFGTFAVKFRAFGMDFGTAKQTILQSEAVVLPVPFPFNGVIAGTPVPIRFSFRGISVDAYLIP